MQKPKTADRLFKIKGARSDLQRLGIDLEYFPAYVNTAPFFHSVDVILLTYIIKGRGTHYMDDDAFAETGVSLGVTHYGQRHTIVTGPEGMEIMNVYLDINKFPLSALPAPLDGVLPMLIPLHPGFGNRLNRIVRVQFDDVAPHVTGLVFSMKRELENHEHGYEESLSLLFKQFLILCCRQILKNGIVPSFPSGRAPSMERIRKQLDTRFMEPLRLAGLAAAAGLSPTYLCRAFRRYCGKSVFEYLLDRRVQATMMSLRSNDRKISAVALESGFNDLAHFNRVFRKRVGRTPRDYRRYR